uniref:Uncharacterized protein n=1 Tax=Schistocephalus solidus TaxID=70667 RepID=A0A0X3NR06_SCHSO
MPNANNHHHNYNRNTELCRPQIHYQFSCQLTLLSALFWSLLTQVSDPPLSFLLRSEATYYAVSYALAQQWRGVDPTRAVNVRFELLRWWSDKSAMRVSWLSLWQFYHDVHDRYGPFLVRP